MSYYRADLGGKTYLEGTGIDIQNNVISMETASPSSLGGAKVDGVNLVIDTNGVLTAKQEQTVTLSFYTSEIYVGGTDTITATTDGGGTLSVQSSDNSVATATISDGVVTITGVGVGSCSITVTAAASGNYKEGSASIAVTAIEAAVYGAQWNFDSSSSPTGTRTDDAVSFADPNPYCSGVSGSGSSPFDNIYPWSDMVIEERTGGTMVKIPKFYYKLTQVGTGGIKIQISAAQKEGFSISPAHMDRGDEAGERDVVYVGRYHSNNTSGSNYKSTTGKSPYASATRATMRTNLHSVGANYWQIDFATRFTIWLLYLVEFADFNSQAKIGYGCGNNSSTQNVGYTDSMTYHTGTTQSSRTTYGCGTQYRHIEGLWDNIYDWLDGCYYNGNGLNIIKNPSNFSDSTGGTAVGTLSTGYTSKFTAKDVAGTFPMFIPSEANGSDSTYSCDYWSSDSSNPCLYAGGSFSLYQGQNRGLFYLGCNSSSSSGAGYGCRLLELP